jgi:hypothetical protein
MALQSVIGDLIRRKKEEGRRKKEEGRRKKEEEGRRKKEEGRRRKKEEGRRRKTYTASLSASRILRLIRWIHLELWVWDGRAKLC